MATTTQTVIIDFQSDFSAVQDAVAILEKAGKVDAALAAEFKKTNTEIKKQGDALEKTATSADKDVKSFSKLADLMKQFPKSGLNRFLLQVGNELAGAGVKAEEFKKKLDPKETITKTQSLKNELKKLREEMQQVAVTSGVLSAEYLALKNRAGELDDTIKDVNADIANAGSDTRGIDNVIGSVSALAGGFSVVQGAAALFGDESEDLQKALLKVNAAMAIATGLQQVQNALTKQGSLVRLADTAATYTQIAAQKIYTFVTGRATAATIGFKVALAATGIGLFVLGLLALNEALKGSTSDLDLATEAIERQNKALEASNELLDRRQRIDIAQAELAGKAESDLIRIRGKSLQQQVSNLEQSNSILKSQRDALRPTSEAWFELNRAIGANNDIIRGLNTDILVASINLEKQLADERKKASDDAIAKAKERNEKALEAAKKARAAGFADFKAGIELQLVEAEKGSLKELDLRKQLARAQLQIDLEAEGLTINQKRLLIQNYFKDRKELESKFNKDIVAIATQGEKDRLQATLANLNLSEEERLQVKIEFLQISAAAEIAAAEGNAAKIRLINAELNAAIAAAKVESIKKSAEEEARLLSATGGAGRRALEAVAADEKMKSDVRINAIRQLATIQTAAIDREIAANRKANDVKGADNRALEIEYEELLDRKAQATEEAEKRITDITKAESKKREEFANAVIQTSLQGLEQLGQVAAGIQQNNQQAAENAIALQKRELDDLVKAGAISEKEAARRNKKIEAEERAAKNRAAKQIKALAVFQAFLAIPQAYLAGLQTPIIGAIVGPIYAALAAVQAGIVAARPVPKFATGKKGSWSGIGIVGDAGAELIERSDGSMEVAMKSTPTYLGAKDIVYTAAETKRILPSVNKEAIGATSRSESFDYVKLAKAMKQKENKTVINIDKDFISESVANGLMKSNYFGKYYKSK
jgi:hypothetical protein